MRGVDGGGEFRKEGNSNLNLKPGVSSDGKVGEGKRKVISYR